MRHPHRRRATVALAGALAAAVMLPVLPASAAPSAVGMPGGVKALRTGPDNTDLSITWRPVTGVDHYTVSVFDGTGEQARVVPADATSFLYEGTGTCTRYRVRVAAVGLDGSVTASNDYLVGSLAPGGPANLTGTRTESGVAGIVEWSAPIMAGASPLSGYDVQVRNMGTGQLVVDTQVPGTRVDLSDLDPSRQYSAKVTPVNSFGSCTTCTTILYGARPAQPRAFVVTRDSATPSRVDITWSAPVWGGYGPVTAFELGWGRGRVTEWVTLPASARSHTLTLEANVNHVLMLRAVSSNDRGNATKPIKLFKHGAPGTPAVDPVVTVGQQNGTISVDTVGPVGSSAAFPKMALKVEPTLNSGSFRDEHVISNGASHVVFSEVPCGVYTVTVTGFGNGAAKEFARQVVNRCDIGLLPANLWRVVYGQAVISGNTVDVTTTGERRIVSTTRRTSQDMVLTTRATLHTGWGFGVWARANLSTGAAVSGYSFQYDPGYANVNAAFGQALLLRLWRNGQECGTPLAKVKFPAGVDVYAPHDIMVVTKGDTLYATIDGKVVFNVASLQGAIASSNCNMPAPTGTEIGFRTWNSSTATFTGTTLS